MRWRRALGGLETGLQDGRGDVLRSTRCCGGLSSPHWFTPTRSRLAFDEGGLPTPHPLVRISRSMRVGLPPLHLLVRVSRSMRVGLLSHTLSFVAHVR